MNNVDVESKRNYTCQVSNVCLVQDGFTGKHLKNLQTMQMSKLSASILIIVIFFAFLYKDKISSQNSQADNNHPNNNKKKLKSPAI